MNIPLDQIRERYSELTSKIETVVVYCGQSLRSYSASRILKELGLDKVVNLEGGIKMWRWELEK